MLYSYVDARRAFADLSGRQFILGCLSPLTQGLLHFNIYCDGTLASYADQRNLHPRARHVHVRGAM
jgi:hypothetical protein